MHSKVKKLIRQLLEQLAPTNMNKGELKKLSQAAGLGESTIRNAKHRQGLTADTLLALLLAQGVDSKDILNLPRKQCSQISPTNFKWVQLGHQLSEQDKIVFMDFIHWSKNKFKTIHKKI